VSQENIRLFREALDAFNRRDKVTWVGLCDPDCENRRGWKLQQRRFAP
jgi:ketosteroid isomerase-like protein